MVTVKEKIGYGLGDTASNIIFQTVMLFLAFFYTDIYGISPAAVGTIFLLVRVFDAITDPIMGAICDRTNTKWGKFRPYLLWLCVPFAIASIAAFTTPNLNESGKILYALFTYAILMLAYTAINIPYCALGGVISADPQERVSIQSYRFIMAMIGGLIVSSSTWYLVDFFGDGDPATGYQKTMTLLSIVCIILFVLCFQTTKERIFPPKEQKSKFKEDLQSLWKNDQWRVLSIITFILLFTQVMRSASFVYYIKYFLGREDLISLFITGGLIGNMLGCAAAYPIAKRFNKIKVYSLMQLVAAIILVTIYFITKEMLVLIFVLFFLFGFFQSTTTPLLWAMMADTVDYGHWKTGVRITAMVYSSNLFFLKLGMALGGAVAGWLLAFYGYQAGVEQSQQSLQGILLISTVFPAIGTLLLAVIIRWYTLDEDKLQECQAKININKPIESLS